MIGNLIKLLYYYLLFEALGGLQIVLSEAGISDLG
jgi:hypothetical protein